MLPFYSGAISREFWLNEHFFNWIAKKKWSRWYASTREIESLEKASEIAPDDAFLRSINKNVLVEVFESVLKHRN